MNFPRVGRRIARIFTTPPEVLYALTRHFCMVTVFVLLGALLMWAKVSTEPVVYEGRAQLLVNPLDTLVVTASPVDHPSFGRTSDPVVRFLNSQTSILSSESVIRRLIGLVGLPSLLSQEEDREKSGYELVVQKLGALEDRLYDFLHLREVPPATSSKDAELQFASDLFRLRSQVIPSPTSSTISLRVYGTRQAMILKELECWIKAYTMHVEEMAKESWEEFLRDRIEHYQKIENGARKELEDFRNSNPDVSELNQEYLGQQIVRLQISRDDVRRQLEFGDIQLSTGPQSRNPDPRTLELQEMRTQKGKYELEIIDLLGKGYTEASDQVQGARNKLQLLQSKLEALENSTSLPGTREEKLRKQLEGLTAELEGLLTRKSKLKDRLGFLANLEENSKRSREKREKYTLVSQESVDLIESRKSVQIQVSDRPTVSAEPFEYHPLRKVLFGLLGGMGCGMFVAFALEVFSSKARFMSDVVHDLGLPVVSVIPRK